MRREKLKLIMGILLLATAYVFSKQAAVSVSGKQMKGKKQDGYTVVIDPGHGGSDPGKVSVSGTKEKNVNLQIALRLKALLEAQDIEVYMTRADDEQMELKQRCAWIAEKQPDCAVSIHQNSYPESGPYGAQTFYYTGSEEGERLAESIQERLVSCLDPQNRRKAKSNSSYYMLKRTEVPIVIVECGFLSNPEEAKLLIRPEYQEKTAWAIHMGVLNYLNGEN